MDFLSKYNLTPAKVIKTVCIGIGVLIALTLLVKLVNLPLCRFKNIMQHLLR